MIKPDYAEIGVNTSTLLCCEIAHTRSQQHPTHDQQSRNEQPRVLLPIQPFQPPSNHRLLQKFYVILPARQGGIEVFCYTQEDINKLQEYMQKADVQADVKRREKRRPRCAIHDVSEQIKSEELIAELSATAEVSANLYKPLFRLKERRPNRVQWIIECTNTVFAAVLKLRKIYTDWQAHTITEFLGIKICFKCQQFGHLQDKCQSKKTFCAYCARLHNVKDCRAEMAACINCGDSNKQFGTHFDYQHPAYDSNCPSYQRTAYNVRLNTEY
ncbi:hypothetical protein X975_15685, partial [Stegodyphus mimosarum]